MKGVRCLLASLNLFYFSSTLCLIYLFILPDDTESINIITGHLLSKIFKTEVQQGEIAGETLIDPHSFIELLAIRSSPVILWYVIFALSHLFF